MACHYRIVLVLDGGMDSLLVTSIGLATLTRKVKHIHGGSSVFALLDMVVASGKSTLIASLITKKEILGSSDILDLEQLFVERAMEDPSQLVLHLFQDDETLLCIRKHFLFLAYDIDSDEPFQFSDSRPTQQTLKLKTVLDACMNEGTELHSFKLGFRHLSGASMFVPNPILHAHNYASCLYQDDSVIIISIGAGSYQTDTLQQILSLEAESEFERNLKEHKKWHYFRFNPSFEWDDSVEEKIQKTKHYFEKQAPILDRLIHLMEHKVGRFV